MSKIKVKMTDWELRTWPTIHLCGQTKDHPLLGNDRVRTSTVLAIDIKQGICETMNTIYLLDPKVPQQKAGGLFSNKKRKKRAYYGQVNRPGGRRPPK